MPIHAFKCAMASEIFRRSGMLSNPANKEDDNSMISDVVEDRTAIMRFIFNIAVVRIAIMRFIFNIAVVRIAVTIFNNITYPVPLSAVAHTEASSRTHFAARMILPVHERINTH